VTKELLCQSSVDNKVWAFSFWLFLKDLQVDSDAEYFRP